MLIESKSKRFGIIILILGGIFSLGISIYMIFIALKQEFPPILSLVLGALFGLFGLFCFWYIWKQNNYSIDGNKLIVKSIFNSTKKTIHIEDIKRYTEIEKETKNHKWKDLTLFTDDYKVIISSSSITNYEGLKHRLVQGKKRDEQAEIDWKHKDNKRFGYAILIIGIGLTGLFVNGNSNMQTEILRGDISTIVGHLENQPEIESRRKKGKWMDISLSEHPEFVFRIGGYRLNASKYGSIVNDFRPDDQIEIDIISDIYEKKISRTREMNYNEKSVNYKNITVYGLRKDDYVYLDLDSINIERKKESSLGIWLILIGISIVGLGVYFIVQPKPSVNSM